MENGCDVKMNILYDEYTSILIFFFFFFFFFYHPFSLYVCLLFQNDVFTEDLHMFSIF